MKKLAVLGHPIGHTLSPVMHNASIRALGLAAEYEYGKLDVPPQQLLERLAQLPGEGYAGVNLTIPLKEVAFKGLEKLSDSARIFGAVNTVEFSADGPVGHNTDGFGFLKALEEAFGQAVQGDSVFVLGCGGSVKPPEGYSQDDGWITTPSGLKFRDIISPTTGAALRSATTR